MADRVLRVIDNHVHIGIAGGPLIAALAAAAAEAQVAPYAERAEAAEEAIADIMATAGEVQGAGSVVFQQAGTGAIVRSALDKMRDTISIKDFGAVGDGFTDETVAFDKAHARATAIAAGGKVPRIVFPQGLYSYATSPNWGSIGRLEMVFEGEVWLAKYGAGPAFVIDGGTTPGVNLIGIRITGFPMIYNDSANDHCVFARAIGDSVIQVNCRSASPAHAGFYGEWLVDNDLHIICSGLEGGSPSFPDKGIHLTTRGTNEDSSYNRIYARVSGDAVTKLPIGIYLDAALGNEIIGTVQNCVLGFKDTTNAWENLFFKVDFEANTADAEIYGQQTQFAHCDFEVGPVFKVGALCGKLIGGTTQNITVQSGAIDTLISAITYNRLRVGGTGTITDAGTRTRFRDLLNGTDGVVHDAPRQRLTPTVGASPYTYTNTSGNDQRVMVYGGTVSQLALSRFSGDPMPVTGQYTLSPGDVMEITYSSPPAVVVWT